MLLVGGYMLSCEVLVILEGWGNELLFLILIYLLMWLYWVLVTHA